MQNALAVSYSSAQPHTISKKTFIHLIYLCIQTLLNRCTYIHCIDFSIQQLERHRDELLLWSAKIRHHVDDLVMQMSKRRALDLVYRAEDHAAELLRLAGALDR